MGLFDHLAKVEGPGGTATYAFDGLERLSERKAGEAPEVFHYGDLADMPTYQATAKAKRRPATSRARTAWSSSALAKTTSFPLSTAHGDVTAIANAAGEVESRQASTPGAAALGSDLEMGYLGAWERPNDPTSGLIQMGARSYDPSLGRFATEDPMLVTISAAQISNRYGFAGNRVPNLSDLTGRYPFEGVVGGAGEMVESWAEDPLNFGDPREMITSAQEYWVQSESPVANVAGPAVSMLDLAVNPDRLDDYIKAHPWAHKQILADCYGLGHTGRTIGGAAGGAAGFGLGFASGMELGPLGAVGVGTVSGAAGSTIGGAAGMTIGCAAGVLKGAAG